MIQQILNELTSFTGREDALRSIYRYSMFYVMFYRNDLFLHSKRVAWLVESLLPLVKKHIPEFNEAKALTLALVHDDAEIITGDAQLGHKVKMTQEELSVLESKEERALEELANRWPEMINGFVYRELLLHALRKDCIEAQVVSLADKIEGFCEAIHEYLVGNKPCQQPTQEVYPPKISEFSKKFPALKEVMNEKHPLLLLPLITESLCPNTLRLHTEESLKKDTGIAMYEKWKKITIDHAEHDRLIIPHDPYSFSNYLARKEKPD